MLDILLFRSEQGGDPDLVRESQRRRYADVALVDQVIEYDQEWRKTRYSLDQALTTRGKTQKEIGGFMKKKETPPPELLEQKKAIEEEIAQLQAKEKECIELRDSTIGKIGNLVPDDVPVHDDEEHNAVVHEFGEFKREDWMLSHYDLIQMAGLANTERGSQVAGSRGYFLTGAGVLLNQALISYAMHFLTSRGATLLQTPFVMNKSLMSKVAQLADFDEQLYKARCCCPSAAPPPPPPPPGGEDCCARPAPAPRATASDAERRWRLPFPDLGPTCHGHVLDMSRTCPGHVLPFPDLGPATA